MATTAAAIDPSAYEKLPELDANMDMAKQQKPRHKKQNLVHKKENQVSLVTRYGETYCDKPVYKPINYTLHKLGCLNYNNCTEFKKLEFPRHKQTMVEAKMRKMKTNDQAVVDR